MLKSLLIAELVDLVKVVTQEEFMNMLSNKVFQILLVNNMLPMILTNQAAQLLIFVKIVLGHHAQLDKLAKINAELLTLNTTMLPTIIASQVPLK